jgi:pyruvate dehydrogenase E2 component (dihydrolipoamide acetyltransferase)
MTMEEGTLTAWHVAEGSAVAVGEELLEIETSKLVNAVEAGQPGILRRQVGKTGQVYPCGALIGVIADASVPEAEVAAFVAEHVHMTREAATEASGPVPQMLEVGGHALRYLAMGEGGVPILLIHGFGGDLNNWLFVQPRLSECRATYAIDLPGHGGSSKDLGRINGFDDLAELVMAFLHQLALDKVHLVAHSMGAAIALALARQHGEHVTSLTLLSPAGLGVAPAAEFVNGFIAAKSRRELTPVLKMLLADERQVSRDMVNDLLKYKRLDGTEAALGRFVEFLATGNRAASEVLAEISAPIQIIWGAQDRIMRPPAESELPSNVRLIVLEGAGHMPHLERSSQTAELFESTFGG